MIRLALTLSLRLPHPKLFCDEAVLDDLVDVFLLGEWSLVVEVHVAHLLADIRLMNTLRMVTHIPIVN